MSVFDLGSELRKMHDDLGKFEIPQPDIEEVKKVLLKRKKNREAIKKLEAENEKLILTIYAHVQGIYESTQLKYLQNPAILRRATFEDLKPGTLLFRIVKNSPNLQAIVSERIFESKAAQPTFENSNGTRGYLTPQDMVITE